MFLVETNIKNVLSDNAVSTPIPLNIEPKHSPLLSRANFTLAPAFRLIPRLNRWIYKYIIKNFISYKGMIMQVLTLLSPS